MTFHDIYEYQCKNQQLLIDNNKYEVNDVIVPSDNTKLSSYHIQQLMSEIGEVLESDKRWKNIRNDKYEPEHKLEEIADCFIVLMNIAIFSGASSADVERAIMNKLSVVRKRFEESVS